MSIFLCDSLPIFVSAKKTTQNKRSLTGKEQVRLLASQRNRNKLQLNTWLCEWKG